MEFFNDTPLAAALLPTSEEDRIDALFLCGLTLTMGPESTAAADQWPLWIDDQLPFPNDVQLWREGVCVCVTGHVYADASHKQGEARLQVGEAERRVLAIGPRVWAKGTTGLTPSPPAAFDRIAMDWTNAYGGAVSEAAQLLDIDGEAAIAPAYDNAHLFNPSGTGFYMRREQAISQPLPLLEDPAHRIRAWDDRPVPVSFAPYPLWGGMRLQQMIDSEDNKVDLARIAQLGVRGAPVQNFPRIETGTVITVAGMRPEGQVLQTQVPPAPVDLQLNIADDEQHFTPVLDAVDINAERAEVRFVYRCLFRYPLIRFQKRSLRVVPNDNFPDLPVRYNA